MAFVLFLMLKAVNKIMSIGKKKEAEEVAAEPIKSDELIVLEEILKELKKKK
jgi:large conductance mechanosensitive channel